MIVNLKEFELSIITALVGTVSGEFFLVLSVISLNLRSFKIWLCIDFSPCSINCLWRLFALISSLVLIKSLIWALLKTFDPISLPSITQPLYFFNNLVTIYRCCLFINFLTWRLVAIWEAFLPISSFLKLLCFL